MKITAIQQIIDQIKKHPKFMLDHHIGVLYNKATELLEVEKEQILDAYCAPYNYEIITPNDILHSAKEYYQSTYKSE